MRRIITWGLILFVGFMFLIVLINPEDKTKENNIQVVKENVTPQQPERVINGKVNETLIMGDWSVRVNSVSTAKRKGYSTAKAGYEYLIVNVTLSNIGKEEVFGTGSLDFKVQDSSGVRKDKTYITLEDAMEGYVDLLPGGALSGSIAFEVPEDDNNLQLVFQPNMWLDDQRIVIDLQE